MWQVLGPILASMAGGAASSAIGNATSRGGQQGYDLPMMTNSPYDAENMRLMAQMAQQGALNYQDGRLPPGMEILLDQIRKRQLQSSQEEMYGRPGQRSGSVMDNTMSLASKGGVGPKAMMAQGSKAMGDYAQRNSQIRNYMDSLKYAGLQQSGQQSFQQMQSMPRSNELPWTGQAIQQNIAPQPGIDIGLGNVDWVKAFDRLTGGTKDTKGTASTAANMAPGAGYENDYNTISPVAGGGYVMGNQVMNTPAALPALPQYSVPAGPQNYSDMYGVPAPSQLPGYLKPSTFRTLQERQDAGDGYTFGWKGGQ